ncbi:FAD-dependent oxidoreductase [Streptomyces sp. HNM0574]|uniref:NAD(P)/FAD-dependent oxidoreductase n=1 Tax=Streptomyces sp. HNM0574 TaxID=2714954 RepID=UPI00146CAE26|nr:FAD-dependent oxidoreductase [Streptomyces sp. HNM0574]NLU70493.1 FAD-dependent oxidoreductase [Streptomyces sp. HNM0574]
MAAEHPAPAARRIAVVGASLGGLRAAEQLRAAGWTERLTVFGDEAHPPYNRPPLSKEVLAGKAAPGSTELRRRASTEDVEWRLGTAVTGCDLAGRRLTLADGSAEPFDGLVAATGIRPRRAALPTPDSAPPRHTVRTREDAAGLRAALVPGARLVVIGAGFVGMETAATARTLGCEVTVTAPERLPMERALGALLAEALLLRHRERGVRFALGRTPAAFTAGGVLLDDGTELPADVVVEAIGSLPNTEWLAGNPGLDLSDGVLVDAALRAPGYPWLVAVGDVARFPNARYGGPARRVEHWAVPGDSAKHAARSLVAHLNGTPDGRPPFAPLPSFWSDQFTLRLQSFGAPALADTTRLLSGTPSPDLLVAAYRAGTLIAVTSLGGPRAAAAAASLRGELG